MSSQEEIIQTNNSRKILQHVTIPRDQPAKGEHLAYLRSGWEEKKQEKFHQACKVSVLLVERLSSEC